MRSAPLHAAVQLDMLNGQSGTVIDPYPPPTVLSWLPVVQ